MQTLHDVHQQFASFFKSASLQPYAYLVSRKLHEGHICLQLNDLKDEAETLPASYNWTGMQTDLQKEHFVTTANGPKQPFVLHNERLYLQRYFNYETMILNRIMQFIGAEKESEAERTDLLRSQQSFIRSLFKPIGQDSDAKVNWPLAAAVSGVMNNFTIITGGPGTGKTTTVAKILAILFTLNSDLKVALAAPTGKAAARMAESLKSASLGVDAAVTERFQSLQPSTIHRLLGNITDSPYFKHNKENPLDYDVLIIDESSMMDVALFAKLLDAIGANTRLILLGDKDQLASVEAGSLFGDLCQAQEMLNVFSEARAALINSLNDLPSSHLTVNEIAEPGGHPLFQHIIGLQHSHRFKAEEGIGKFSAAIIRNNEEVIKGFLMPGADQQVQADLENSQESFRNFVMGYEDYLREKDIATALKKLNGLKILCAIREGEQGLYALNRKVEKYLQDRKLISLSQEFYEHRPIMVTSNNYPLDLFNGDMGIIRKDKNGLLKAWFENSEGKLKPVIPGLLSSVETAYAMTIHKSQGSEFDRVMIVLPDAEDISILTRELLYTGVTRAKKEIVLQGKESVILGASKRQVQRASGIALRFLEQ
jgi:exodeoxyribonuclease V alpha subunit